MAETRDAYTLISEADNPIEREYANYANQMKAMGNRARKEMLDTGKIEYSATAKKAYQPEVDSLISKLNLALQNAPKERQAQALANAEVKAKREANPDMTKQEIKKAGQQALTKARAKVGAKRTPISITDREWQAIQSGAISEARLSQIINHVDLDDLKERATPRTRTQLSQAKVNKMNSMKNSGYTIDEIAQALGVSRSTVSKYLRN